MAYHDANVRDVEAKRVQVDEIWSFVYSKQKNVATAKAAPEGDGDTWTWTAIDADSKLILSYLIGGRDSEYAIAFMDDLRSRLANRSNSPLMGTRHIWKRLRGPLAAIWTMPCWSRCMVQRRKVRSVTALRFALAHTGVGSRAIPISITSARLMSSVKT